MDRRTVLRRSVAALAGGVAASGAAVAQQSPEPTETPTPTEEPPDETRVQLDAALTVADYEFVDGEFRIDFRAEAFRRVAVTDVGAMVESLRGGDGARAVEIPFRTATLSRGETRLTIGATTVDGEAMVTVATSEKLVLLRTGPLDNRGPVEWGTAQALAAGSAVGSASIVYRRLKHDDEEPEEVERIA